MAEVWIDKSTIVQLATALLLPVATTIGAGCFVTPVGEADPTDYDILIRMEVCDIKPLRRTNLSENHLADVKIIIGIVVSEERSAADGAALDGAASLVEQAMSCKFTEDAGTTHTLSTDEADHQEAQVPDEQKRIRAATVTVVGQARRATGTSVTHT